MRKIMERSCLVVFIILVLLVGGVLFMSCLRVREWDEVHRQPPAVELDLKDDRLADKKPVFDEALVDSRPMAGWEINKSDAVIRLDCPDIRVESEEGSTFLRRSKSDARSGNDAELLVLRPSYRDASRGAVKAGYTLLPSANLADGAAKQFDDGLYACLDLACYRGELGFGPAAPEVIQHIFEALPQDSPAQPFLAAALELGGRQVELSSSEVAAKDKYLRNFEQDEERSKPIGFYTWTPELKEVWRFFRFLQHEFDERALAVPGSIAQTLEMKPALLERYRAFNAFYGRLTNPMGCLSVDALIGEEVPLRELARKHGARRVAVSFFPPSTSREGELFDRVFGTGLPANVNLMGEFIRRIRSGDVELKPGDKDGWYQYQVYALETMLLPGKGQEADKLLLMATYKKRLVEAFKALITKRRETHVRQMAAEKSAVEEIRPLKEVRPRLRVEPCATFYLRTARAYAFLQNFLAAVAEEGTLKGLHGLRKDGTREENLLDELDAIRQRFYGLYLVACEDIGMRPSFLDGEAVDQAAAKEAALDWLDRLENDPDLACDTRVSVPIFREEIRGATRMWGTLGVRLARLDASYARPPRVRPRDSGGPWETVKSHQLEPRHYVIPVDEFGEFELRGMTSLTREEFRAVCDEHKTKEEILEALSR